MDETYRALNLSEILRFCDAYIYIYILDRTIQGEYLRVSKYILVQSLKNTGNGTYDAISILDDIIILCTDAYQQSMHATHRLPTLTTDPHIYIPAQASPFEVSPRRPHTVSQTSNRHNFLFQKLFPRWSMISKQ